MSRYTLTELKRETARLVEDLDGGHAVTLTRRGRPVGVLVPVEAVTSGQASAHAVAALYADGQIGPGPACKLLGLGYVEFLDLVGHLGYGVYDEAAWREDLKTARRLPPRSSSRTLPR